MIISSEREKKDMLSFRIELATELIGCFPSPERAAGRPRSSEHVQLDRLNPSLGHWPIQLSSKGRCVVCLEIVRKKSLPTIGHRHVFRIQCEYCKVPLCVAAKRNCFKKYHTLVTFSQ